MSKRIAAIIVFFLAGSMSAADGGPSEWTGLWRLNQQTEHGPVQLHFHVPDGNAPLTFYGAGWDRLIVSESKTEGAVFLLNWQAKGTNVVFDGRRIDGRISGSWQLVHPQYSDKGSFSAQRVLPNGRWSPLDAVKSLGTTSRLVDLNALLVEKSRVEADFGKYWEKTFRPDFYVFLAEAPSPAEVQRILNQPGFSEKAKWFASQLKELSDASRLKLSGLRLSIPIVALPFGDAEPQPLWVDETPFVLVNVDRFGERIPQERRRAYFAEKILEANLRYTLPNLVGDPYELWREGVHAFLAAKAGFAAPHEAMAVSAEQLKALESDRSSLKKRWRAGENLASAERAFLAYDFVASAASGKSPTELTGMMSPDILKAFRNYLGQ